MPNYSLKRTAAYRRLCYHAVRGSGRLAQALAMKGCQLVILVLCFLLQSCARSEADAASEDVAVLKAVISDSCASKKAGFLVLYSESQTTDENLKAEDFDPKTLENLHQRNKHPSELPRSLACGGIRVVEKSAIDASFHHKPAQPFPEPRPGWEGFYTTFVGATGSLRLSLPGYSPDHTLAVVYDEGACARLCSSAHYTQLRKVGGKWLIEKTLVVSFG